MRFPNSTISLGEFRSVSWYFVLERETDHDATTKFTTMACHNGAQDDGDEVTGRWQWFKANQETAMMIVNRGGSEMAQ